ncbi:MAG: hypothetical protein JSR36_04900 [Proteobacteria bacterium]|nr:hypothetical protein [Pseudomonadota bacterium]
MNTATKILSALTGTLTLCPALCSAAPPVGVAHPLGTARPEGLLAAPGLSLAAVRPHLAMAGPPQPLDTPRPAGVDLHVARGDPATEREEPTPGLHNPRGLHWQDGSAPISPALVSLARNYHREGLPLVRLWQADRNMVSIGLNPRGVPGLYFTQKMGR